MRRLDDGVSRSSYVADLFSPELSLYRAKLADHVLRLVVAEPLKHGVGAIDAHWRKAVYETIVRARNIKVGMNKYSSFLGWVCEQRHLSEWYLFD